jgi:putative hydrolase of the HAD superfamily
MVIMLILDLDNTIYNTSTINRTVFSPVIEVLKKYYGNKYNETKVTEVISDFWTKPIDVVLKTHCPPKSVENTIFKCLENIRSDDLKINPYPDYAYLKGILQPKVLLTSGYESFQNAKIIALGIEKDFVDVIIDDPRASNRLFKSGIFEKIIDTYNKMPEEFWIIGDNPDSEILAGSKLGMKTIQRKTRECEVSMQADYVIESFVELERIIDKE